MSCELFNFGGMPCLHLQTGNPLSHHGKFQGARKICSFSCYLFLKKKKRNSFKSLGWPGSCARQKKKGWEGVWGVRVLEHIIYQFANQLKSVNSGAGAARNAPLIPHQCSPFMWCNFILYKILFFRPSLSVTVAQRGTEGGSQFQQWQKTAQHPTPTP